jgi:hypothetical protein
MLRELVGNNCPLCGIHSREMEPSPLGMRINVPFKGLFPIHTPTLQTLLPMFFDTMTREVNTPMCVLIFPVIFL